VFVAQRLASTQKIVMVLTKSEVSSFFASFSVMEKEDKKKPLPNGLNLFLLNLYN
jgi:hypothetical protein